MSSAVTSTRPLRVVFMGTPDFSVGILEAIVSAGMEVVAVFSQPPRKSGRGLKETPSPVHARAQQLGIPVQTPSVLKTHDAQVAFETLCNVHAVDVAVVVAYGLILPERVLKAPRLGCVNVHASLLPRWRGAAPIQRAIEARDVKTGITYMQMDKGLDTGPMLHTIESDILVTDTGGQLHDRLARIGAEGIVTVLNDLNAGLLMARQQPETGISYARKLDKSEGLIDWTRPASDIEALIRAFTPWPGAFTHFTVAGTRERLKILEARVLPDLPPLEMRAGTLLSNDLIIACGQGCLQLLKLQKSGKAVMQASDFLRGNTLPEGTIFS